MGTVVRAMEEVVVRGGKGMEKRPEMGRGAGTNIFTLVLFLYCVLVWLGLKLSGVDHFKTGLPNGRLLPIGRLAFTIFVTYHTYKVFFLHFLK